MQGFIKPRLFLFLGDPDRPPRADDLEDDDGHNEGVDRHDDHAEELHEELMDAGVPVSINSDDPPFFCGDLNENYEAVVRTFRLAKPELHALAKSAFTNSYAPQTMVNGWIQELDDYFSENDFIL